MSEAGCGFTVAVLSAYRPETCSKATVPMLLEGGVPARAITVYVPNEEQAAEYRPLIPSYVGVVVAPHDPFDKSLPSPDRPSEGQATARNIASDHQAGLPAPPWAKAKWADRWVWWIDDDVTGLVRLAWKQKPSGEPARRQVPIKDVRGWMENVGAEADALRASLIGILPSQNALTMADDRTLGLSFCIGQVYANRASTHVRSWLSEKNDYERSILHYLQDGGCFRVNDVCARSKVYSGSGGLQLSRTFARSHAGAQWLVERYPHLVRINPKRTKPVTEGRAELLLARPPGNQKLRRPWEWE